MNLFCSICANVTVEIFGIKSSQGSYNLITIFDIYQITLQLLHVDFIFRNSKDWSIIFTKNIYLRLLPRYFFTT